MINNNSFENILNYINEDNLIIYPTSTLPALGCKPNKSALDKLFLIKKRQSKLPVSLSVLDLEQVSDIVKYDETSVELLNSFPKGSLTLLLPAKKTLDQRLGGEWVGVRPVTDTRARQLISQCGPLTATSANISGEEPKKDCKLAAQDLKLKHDQYIPGVTNGGLPSTLVKVDKEVSVMREGVISRKEVVAWSMKMI